MVGERFRGVVEFLDGEVRGSGEDDRITVGFGSTLLASGEVSICLAVDISGVQIAQLMKRDETLLAGFEQLFSKLNVPLDTVSRIWTLSERDVAWEIDRLFAIKWLPQNPKTNQSRLEMASDDEMVSGVLLADVNRPGDDYPSLLFLGKPETGSPIANLIVSAMLTQPAD